MARPEQDNTTKPLSQDETVAAELLVHLARYFARKPEAFRDAAFAGPQHDFLRGLALQICREALPSHLAVGLLRREFLESLEPDEAADLCAAGVRTPHNPLYTWLVRACAAAGHSADPMTATTVQPADSTTPEGVAAWDQLPGEMGFFHVSPTLSPRRAFSWAGDERIWALCGFVALACVVGTTGAVAVYLWRLRKGQV